MTQTISRRGLDHLVELEALRLMMYRDQGGYPTIGVGHLLTEEELRTGQLRIGEEVVAWRERGLTEDQAMRLLDQDLDWAEAAVRKLVTVPLTQHQFDALVSFVFNVGPGSPDPSKPGGFYRSTLRRLLNAGDYAAVPGQMRRWVYTGQPPIRSRGLANRREGEIALWRDAA
jgi:lysozyme